MTMVVIETILNNLELFLITLATVSHFLDEHFRSEQRYGVLRAEELMKELPHHVIYGTSHICTWVSCVFGAG